MPVVAVAAIYMGGAALVAGAVGFAAIAAFGAIVAGVGVLTGNKNMVKIGGVMGIVGGVGAWGSTASNFSDGQALWDDPFVANAGEGAAEVAQTTSGAGEGEVMGGQEAGLADSNVTNSSLGEGQQIVNEASAGAQVVNAPPPVDAGAANIDSMMGNGDIAGTNPGLIDTFDDPIIKAGTAPGDPVAAIGAGTPPVDAAAANIDSMMGNADVAGVNPDLRPTMPGAGLFDGVKDWLTNDKNQMLKGALAKSLAAGFSTEGDARDAYYAAKTAETYMLAKAEEDKLKRANEIPDLTKKYFLKTAANKRTSIPTFDRPGLMSSTPTRVA